MRVLFIRLIWIVICSSLTLIGVGWGVKYDWPDFVHVDYGFPAKWATHTLITFTGPANAQFLAAFGNVFKIGSARRLLFVG
jgi:hypothetical protein